jgi:hypothetical protein
MLIYTGRPFKVRIAEGATGAPCHQGRHLSQRRQEGLGADRQDESGYEGGGCKQMTKI